MDLEPNEAVSFYWEEDANAFWVIRASELKKTYFEKNSTSSITNGYSATSLSKLLNDLKAPKAVISIAQRYLELKPATDLRGLHLNNIFGEHALGDKTISCHLDTKGAIWLGSEDGSIGLDPQPGYKVHCLL